MEKKIGQIVRNFSRKLQIWWWTIFFFFFFFFFNVTAVEIEPAVLIVPYNRGTYTQQAQFPQQ